ncbi:hypothetical protein RAY_128 [Erwinia phage vB_EamM_RAY]|uniref:Uncharacterized protein n=4 Tax=Agricanvirus ray TaxID=1984779 RepID=A0A173GER2_9CAUD|nr:hypothetical protein FDH98_gp128 [Erwinia phage vB_EamM_RAY]ANH51909.1 hypothetical protein RAY_128 [Erwinia phage vB_EamM_RAY]AUG85916.1 hypothetical protein BOSOLAPHORUS_129 [Erwinia phage vB_EamM_Bosolaphorus]AUG86881.1 hypothetical protein MORTIMER_132 [Erwinia phage vB_EamM_Mortimer]QBP07236.1 hypothetical protein REBECCA_129 [Erwinia phage Rebecca]
MVRNNVVSIYKPTFRKRLAVDPMVVITELQHVFTVIELCKASNKYDHRVYGKLLKDEVQLVRDCAAVLVRHVQTPSIVQMLQTAITHEKPVELIAARHGEFLQLIN